MVKNEDKPFCVNCSFIKKQQRIGHEHITDQPRCTHDDSGKMNLVTGKRYYERADIMRLVRGVSGKLFEKKA